MIIEHVHLAWPDRFTSEYATLPARVTRSGEGRGAGLNQTEPVLTSSQDSSALAVSQQQGWYLLSDPSRQARHASLHGSSKLSGLTG